MVAIGATTEPITPTIVITTTDAAGGDGGDVVDPTVCKFFFKVASLHDDDTGWGGEES